MATGNDGRHLLNISSVIEPICVEEALKHIRHNVNAVVSMGGEDLVVYTVTNGRSSTTSPATSAPRAPASSSSSSWRAWT